MTRYLAQRLAGSVFVLLGVALATFLILHLAPGDPAQIMSQEGATREQVEKLRQQMGLDRPLYVQFGRFVGRLVRGDLGLSVYTDEPVAELIGQRFPVTLSLAVGGLLLSLLLGVPAGVLAATRRDSPFDYGVIAVTLAGLCMPVFWRGILLILVFAVVLKWFPVSGSVPLAEGVIPYLKHMALPWFSLCLTSLGLVARLVRAGVLEELGTDYVRTARAKGLAEGVVVYRHALRNALISVITVTGLQLGTLMGGAVLTETVFSLPGLGRLVVRAIAFRDYPIVQGSLVFIAALFVFVNLAVDLLYGVADPRVRYQ
jgi:ABC-type dipeptide/oligopeptide/nickel transport system permease component